MKIVNSYTIFGDTERWAGSFATLIREHFTLYPTWELVIHCDKDLSDSGYCRVLKKLRDEGYITLVTIPTQGQYHQNRWKCMMMLWRLLPLWNPSTDYVFCRDADSMLTPRQLQCCLQFIQSGRIAHGINDNAAHDIPLMGGMCGFKSKDFSRMFESLEKVVNSRYSEGEWQSHGTDQRFLMDHIWPSVRNSSVIHKLTGPNSRGHLKKLFNVNISHVPEKIQQSGDDITAYIGAVGTHTDVRAYTGEEIIALYNEYGNKAVCDRITQIENEFK